MRILVPTSVHPSKKNLRTIYINNVKKYLDDLIDLELAWVVYQPEPIQLSENSKIKIFDIHQFKNSVDLLKQTKPDCVMVTSSLDPIQYSLSLACKFLKIPLACFYYNDPITRKIDLIKNTSVVLRIFFSDQLPTDNIHQQKKMRRGKFFIYKYLFLIKTKQAMHFSFLSIFTSIFKEIVMYLTNKNLFSNIYADMHFLPNLQMAEELSELNIEKNKIFVTGNPIWDSLYKNSEKLEKQVVKTGKINLLIITDALFEHGIWSKDQRNNFLISLFQIIVKDKDILFSIKIHPTSENKEYYLDLLNNLNLKNNIYQNEDLEQLLPKFDIVLTYGFSTIHTELSSLGIRTVFFEIDSSFIKMPMFNEGITSGHIIKCINFSDLLPAVHSLFKKEISLSDAFLKQREKLFYKFDGKSGRRVSQLLLDHIKNHPNKQ
jgi:hypothetical protein